MRALKQETEGVVTLIQMEEDGGLPASLSFFLQGSHFVIRFPNGHELRAALFQLEDHFRVMREYLKGKGCGA